MMKRSTRFNLFIAISLVLFSCAVFGAIPQPVIYMPFNSDWASQTGSGNDTAQYIVYKNRAPYSDEGVWGNCVRYNPASHYSAGGTVYYPDGGFTDAVLDSGLEQFTICGWFRSDSVPVNATTILTRHGNGGAAGPGYLRIMFDDFGRLRLIVNNVWEDQFHWFATEDTWTFFAVTYDGSASSENVTWYYGTETAASSVQAGNSATYGSLDGGSLGVSDQPLVLGDDDTIGRHSYDGSLDEIRVFNQVLTAQQIEEVRQLISATPPSDPLFDPANVPEPLVYLPYDGIWDNMGTAGGSEVTILTSYDEGTNSVIGPGFAEGIRGQCLDLSMRTSQTSTEENGGVRYDNNNDPNAPMKAALNGLRSFTICGWMKVDETNIQNGTTMFFFQKRDGQLYEYKIRILNNNDWGSAVRTVLNNNWGPYEPTVWWNFQPADGWQFRAVTYNADDFGQEEKWYYATPVLTAGFRTSRPQSAGVLEDSNEPILMFPAYDGFADEVYLFGSKTDGSGALSLEQIQYVASKVYQNFVCGTEGYPVPEGDTNADCVVDIEDVANMSYDWLIGN